MPFLKSTLQISVMFLEELKNVGCVISLSLN